MYFLWLARVFSVVSTYIFSMIGYLYFRLFAQVFSYGWPFAFLRLVPVFLRLACIFCGRSLNLLKLVSAFFGSFIPVSPVTVPCIHVVGLCIFGDWYLYLLWLVPAFSVAGSCIYCGCFFVSSAVCPSISRFPVYFRCFLPIFSYILWLIYISSVVGTCTFWGCALYFLWQLVLFPVAGSVHVPSVAGPHIFSGCSLYFLWLFLIVYLLRLIPALVPVSLYFCTCRLCTYNEDPLSEPPATKDCPVQKICFESIVCRVRGGNFFTVRYVCSLHIKLSDSARLS